MSNKIIQTQKIESHLTFEKDISKNPKQDFKLPSLKRVSNLNKQRNFSKLKNSYIDAYGRKSSLQDINSLRIKRHQKSISSYNLIDYSLNSVMVKLEAPYHEQNKNDKTSILSTKVDFFNEDNQRRLRVSRNKSIQQISGEKNKGRKPEIQVKRKSKEFMSAKLHYLLKNYLIKKETKDHVEEQYLVVGKNRDQYPQEQQIEQNQDGQQFRRRFHKWH